MEVYWKRFFKTVFVPSDMILPFFLLQFYARLESHFNLLKKKKKKKNINENLAFLNSFSVLHVYVV